MTVRRHSALPPAASEVGRMDRHRRAVPCVHGATIVAWTRHVPRSSPPPATPTRGIDSARNHPIQSRSASASSGSPPWGLRHLDPTCRRTGDRWDRRPVRWTGRTSRQYPLRVGWGGILGASMDGLEWTHEGVLDSSALAGARFRRPQGIGPESFVFTLSSPSTGSLVWCRHHRDLIRCWDSHRRHGHRYDWHCGRPSGSHSFSVSRTSNLGISGMDGLQQQ